MNIILHFNFFLNKNHYLVNNLNKAHEEQKISFKVIVSSDKFDKDW